MSILGINSQAVPGRPLTFIVGLRATMGRLASLCSTGHGTITKPDTNNACGWATVADVMTAMQSGNAYINVHTAVHPTGEIRGQIR